MAVSETPSLFQGGIRFQDGTLQTTAASGGGTPPLTIAKITHEWLDSYTSTTGAFTQSQPAAADLSDSASSAGNVLRANGTSFISAQLGYGDLSGLPTLAATIAATTHKWLNSYTSTTGAFTQSQPAAADLSDTATSGNVLRGNGVSFVSAQLGYSDLSGLPTLYTNPMTTLGDILYENATPAAARLAGNTTSTRNFLRSLGAGSAATAPVWDTLQAGDIPSLAASIITSGVLALARGGNTFSALGDLIYGGAAAAPTILSGNTTSTKQFLTQTGNGTISAAPAWGALASGDIPSNAANTSGTSAGLSGTPSITVATLTATTISSGALSGTFTGAPTMSGNISFTGTPTFSNTLALNTSGTAGGLSGTPAIAVGAITNTTLTASALITGKANIQLGVAGTTSGVITLEGSTSGASTITGPATAGTVTNPIVFSNAIGIGSATAGVVSTAAGALQAGYSGAASPFQGDGTNSRRIPMTLYTGVSHAATGNVTAYATLLRTPGFSTGSTTLVANQQTIGSIIHIRAGGSITVGVAQTLNFGMKLNTASIWAGASATTAVGTNANYWEGDFWCYLSAVGAASTAVVKTWGIVKVMSSGTTTAGVVWPVFTSTVTSTAATVATTGTQLIDIGMFFGSTNSSNTCTCLYCEVILE